VRWTEADGVGSAVSDCSALRCRPRRLCHPGQIRGHKPNLSNRAPSSYVCRTKLCRPFELFLLLAANQNVVPHADSHTLVEAEARAPGTSALL